MAEDKPLLHIDNDWKKQAQEEKKRLAEAAAQPKPAIAAPAAASTPTGGRERSAGRAAEAPQASFASLVQTLMTQVLFYLGEVPTRSGEGMINFDMARYQLDMLGILEVKTTGNLTEDEKKLIDVALYETRMRFVSVASQYIQ